MHSGLNTLLAFTFSVVAGGAQSHWSYVAPLKPALPDVADEEWNKKNPKLLINIFIVVVKEAILAGDPNAFG